ncbi:hypothetical protein HH303_10330 [Rhodospirillaceae bacterium KN72]|uniref:histidine kinase n=1 Tax=Pacificispira spongiicola TaxID=2729598 RepID=A0A7Y0HGY2_9PROT|nr:ATP-binding protein [Pacificispira spongiicola]NMM44874.1 hypothetical protein [Pacificispira spongiicola]
MTGEDDLKPRTAREGGEVTTDDPAAASIESAPAPDTVASGLKRRIILALIIIVALISIDYAVGHIVTHAQNGAALEINMSGRQRMLSQRIAGLTQEAVKIVSESGGRKAEPVLAVLRSAIDLMRQSHTDLTIGNPDLGIDPPTGPLREHYFGTVDLDHRVWTFLAAAERNAARLSILQEGENTNSPDIDRVIAAARQPLLYDLDVAVRLYQKKAETAVASLQHMQLIIWSGTVVAVIAIALRILFPVVTMVRDALSRLEESRTEAEAANVAKSQFLSTMSHELRTPIHGIAGMAELLSRSELDDRRRGFVDVIKTSCDQLKGIVDDILDFSALDTGRMRLTPVPVSLTELADAVLKRHAAAAENRNVRLSMSVDPECARPVLFDPKRLEQILSHLVGNAVKFTENGTADLRIVSDGPDWLVCTVADTGLGLDPNQIDTLFEPFRQADQSARRAFGGAGLGLTIVKRLTEAMGGTITVAGAPGTGATFTLRLPARYAPGRDEDRVSAGSRP